jgi:hypothetical protein
MWEELHSASHTISTSFGGMYRVAAVMLGGASKVPAVDSVHGPCAAAVGCFVYQNFGAGWGERRFIVVEGPVEVCFGRQTRVETGRSQ